MKGMTLQGNMPRLNHQHWTLNLRNDDDDDDDDVLSEASSSRTLNPGVALYYVYCCIVLQFRGVYPLNIEKIADFPAGKSLVSSDSLSAQFLQDWKSMLGFQTLFFKRYSLYFLVG